MTSRIGFKDRKTAIAENAIAVFYARTKPCKIVQKDSSRISGRFLAPVAKKPYAAKHYPCRFLLRLQAMRPLKAGVIWNFNKFAPQPSLDGMGKMQQIEHVICHETIMRQAHDENVSIMFHDMRQMHG
ncbi:hypothetical protein [Thalassospira lucentensis]|uniref:hypothetical protein n=1 Tax=Thalassospira lucentensis TaxID=168935 RepID=UPI003AA8D7B9